MDFTSTCQISIKCLKIKLWNRSLMWQPTNLDLLISWEILISKWLGMHMDVVRHFDLKEIVNLLTKPYFYRYELHNSSSNLQEQESRWPLQSIPKLGCLQFAWGYHDRMVRQGLQKMLMNLDCFVIEITMFEVYFFNNSYLMHAWLKNLPFPTWSKKI